MNANRYRKRMNTNRYIIEKKRKEWINDGYSVESEKIAYQNPVNGYWICLTIIYINGDRNRILRNEIPQRDNRNHAKWDRK